MQRRNEGGRAIPKMPGPTRVIALLDQYDFKLERTLTNHVSMNRIEDTVFPSISNQQNEMALRREHRT